MVPPPAAFAALIAPTRAACVHGTLPLLAAADATARRMLAGDSSAAENDLVVALFELLFNTTPMADERAEILAFVRQIQNRITADGGKDADLQAWSQVCQALFASSRFQILD